MSENKKLIKIKNINERKGNKMITLTVEKDWTGKYTFIVSNGFDSQSFTPGTVVSDFQIDQAKQNIQYAGSIDDGIRVVKNALGII